MNTATIRKNLRKISLTTAHARMVKNNTICHLLTYKKSVSDGDIDLNALGRVCEGLLWLLGHVREIDDKEVLPSERLFLAQAYQACFERYERHTTI